MPEWGMTRVTRKTRPYGLNDWWLQPGKVITDPIHGDVFVTRLEQTLLDTPPMQRLRRVRQLGTTHFAYPGATHTRFSHSLGAVRVVQTIFDAVSSQRNRLDAPDDLFTEWVRKSQNEEGTGNGAAPNMPEIEPGEPLWRRLYGQRLAEATVLARLGALLHDIGHLPFGHTIEDDLGLLTPHDEGACRFDLLWDRVLKSCKAQIARQAEREDRDAQWKRERYQWLTPLRPGEMLHNDLRRLILAKEKDKSGQRIDATKNISYPFVADMVGNTICADLLDYLKRDHVFSGLPISLGQRYLSSFYITPTAKAGIYKQRMALVIHRKGRERKDIVTEILKHLRYRYELQERVLVHHTKLAADAMVGKMIELWLMDKRLELEQRPELLQHSESPVPGRFKFPDENEFTPNRPERVARWSLEELFLRHGDDGVLERIAEPCAEQAETEGGASELATMLLDRVLFKPAANALRPAAAEGLYKEFGTSSSRHKLEREACRHAGLEHDWHLVLWVPDPQMRLKQAELLVDDGQGIAQFKDQSQRGSDIYEAHKELWTISAFVHPTVTVYQTRAALAKLAQEMGVSWDTHRDDLGPNPDIAPLHLAASKACGKQKVSRRIERLMDHATPEVLASRRGEPATQEELDRAVQSISDHLDKPERTARRSGN